jgi:hypothetical protein
MTVTTGHDNGVVNPGTVANADEAHPAVAEAERTLAGAQRRQAIRWPVLKALGLLNTTLTFAICMTAKAQRELRVAAEACDALVDELLQVDADLACIILSLQAECLHYLWDEPGALRTAQRSEDTYATLTEPSSWARARHEANLLLPDTRRSPHTSCEFIEGLAAAVKNG